MRTDVSLTDCTSGALRVAFQHLEEAEVRTRKAADRLDVEIDLEQGEAPQDAGELVKAYSTIRRLRREISEELTNRDEPFRK